MIHKLNHKDNTILIFFTGLIRIKGVFNWSAISFVGFILGISSLNFSDYIMRFIVFAVCTFCILSFTFIINNYYDVESDCNNPKKARYNAMASGKISKKIGIFSMIIFVAVPTIVSFLFNLSIFLFCLSLLFLMWAYSSPPLRLKGRPGIDIVWHFFAFVLLIMWGSYIAGSINLINWLFAVSFGVYSCVEQILNHIYDYEFDKKSGTTTFVVWLGIDKVNFVLKMVVVLHLMLLIPLLILYSFSYLVTIIILVLGIVVGLFIVRLKKQSSKYPLYYLPITFGVAVYVTCIVYYICMLLGEPTLGLIKFIS